MISDVVIILEKHPELRGILGSVSGTERLGGLTNRNFLVESSLGKFVLRIPGEGTQSYINRAHEKVAATITADLGVNAPLLFFDAATGIQLGRYLEGAVTMDGPKFKNKGSIARAARSFRKVHESGRKFENRFELFAMVDSYLGLLKEKDAKLPDGFLDAKKDAERIRAALGRHPLPLSPCHCDPLAENFLDTGERMFIVDWEYSGNNDPMWDLGDLSVEAGFDAEQDRVLMDSYFEGEVPSFDRGRMFLYKAMCDLLWTLWGVIQHTDKNPADDFWAYSLNRFRRCLRAMKDPAFEAHLAAVNEGPAVLR